MKRRNCRKRQNYVIMTDNWLAFLCYTMNKWDIDEGRTNMTNEHCTNTYLVNRTSSEVFFWPEFCAVKLLRHTLKSHSCPVS